MPRVDVWIVKGHFGELEYYVHGNRRIQYRRYEGSYGSNSVQLHHLVVLRDLDAARGSTDAVASVKRFDS